MRTNLMSLYNLASVPSDSDMRKILGPVDPAALAPEFRKIIAGLQRHGAMRTMQLLDRQLLLAIDGTPARSGLDWRLQGTGQLGHLVSRFLATAPRVPQTWRLADTS